MTDVWKTFERGRQWQVLQKYALRFASQKVSEELRELWLETGRLTLRQPRGIVTPPYLNKSLQINREEMKWIS